VHLLRCSGPCGPPGPGEIRPIRAGETQSAAQKAEYLEVADVILYSRSTKALVLEISLCSLSIFEMEIVEG